MFDTKLKAQSAALAGALALSFGLCVLAAEEPGAASRASGAEGTTVLLRTPNHGIQPQVAIDAKGVVHLLYFKGEPAGGDVYYARSEDGSRFTDPVRVNSGERSVVAAGTIRGAQLALGKNGRVHVAWNGSHKATPKAPGGGEPMLYARLDDKGAVFESQRNLIRSAEGLDGGGSVTADGDGNVYVFWHAPDPGTKGEDNRRVWVAASADEGKTFAPERAASTEPTGACGCCGLRAFASGGKLYALYRGAKDVTQRDVHLLRSADKGKTFSGEALHPWEIKTCPMSSMALADAPDGAVLGAWDTKGQVYFVKIDPKTGKRSDPIAAPGAGKGRKHPALAANARGETLFAWTEGTGWKRGGSVAWQVYDQDGKPSAERGRADGVPVWGLVAAFVRPDGRFAIVY
ncbi:MAG: sialidase family protein [Gemmataceae bacterium]